MVQYKVLIKTQRREDENKILSVFGDISEWITSQMPEVNIGNLTVLPMAGIAGGLSFTVSGATKALRFLPEIIKLLPSLILALTGYIVTTEVLLPASKGSLSALMVIAVVGLIILR